MRKFDFSNKFIFYKLFENSDFKDYANKVGEFERAYNQFKQIGKDINSLHTEIKDKGKEIVKQAQEIQEKYNAICQDEDKNSLYTEVVKNSDRISQIEKQATGQLKIISQKLEELEEKIQKNNEFLSRLEQQREKIISWEKEIENLLKKATNASLASSYEESQENYECAIIGWNATFIFSVLGILGIAIWGFVEIADKMSDPFVIFGVIFARLPFYVPLSWLAIFATNRRNENKKLQEEYRHKETLAKAYIGYKEQIEKLEDEKAQELAAKLMQNLVEMTNENPNRALDKVKVEKVSVLEILEKFSNLPKETLSLISKAKNQ